MITSQKSSSAAAAAIVARIGPGAVVHIQGYNAKGSAQFIQLHDAAAVPSDAVSAVAEISTVDFNGSDPASLAGTYFLLSSPTVDYYVWFRLDGVGSDPALAGKTGIRVDIQTANADTDIAVAVADVLDNHAAFNASLDTKLVTITAAVAGACTNISEGTSLLDVATTQQGVTAAVAAVPIAVITVPASSNFQIPLPQTGIFCGNGVVVCNSSAYATKVAGSADCFFTVVVL